MCRLRSRLISLRWNRRSFADDGFGKQFVTFDIVGNPSGHKGAFVSYNYVPG